MHITIFIENRRYSANNGFMRVYKHNKMENI